MPELAKQIPSGRVREGDDRLCPRTLAMLADPMTRLLMQRDGLDRHGVLAAMHAASERLSRARAERRGARQG